LVDIVKILYTDTIKKLYSIEGTSSSEELQFM